MHATAPLAQYRAVDIDLLAGKQLLLPSDSTIVLKLPHAPCHNGRPLALADDVAPPVALVLTDFIQPALGRICKEAAPLV